jgi:hypothetical protein
VRNWKRRVRSEEGEEAKLKVRTEKMMDGLKWGQSDVEWKGGRFRMGSITI